MDFGLDFNKIQQIIDAHSIANSSVNLIVNSVANPAANPIAVSIANSKAKDDTWLYTVFGCAAQIHRLC
jgi:tryptophanase